MLSEHDYRSLCSAYLFDGLSEQELSELLRHGEGIVRSYHRGAIIAFRGDRYDRLLIVLEGEISAEIQDYDGRVLKIETLRASETVASAVLFSSDPLLPVNVHAAADVRLYSIHREEVLRLCQRNERILRNLLQDNGDKLAILAEKLRLIQFASIREKLASYLLDQADTRGTESFELPVSKEQLAEIFGVTRPSLSREFSSLCSESMLCQHGRHIQILDRAELKRILTEHE
jgi:CRP-like cAMP-binding protein